jgi:formylglycine-generating enzyme required for sulfatase activity
MELEPGRYEVEATANGFESQKEWVELGAGIEQHLKIQLTARQAPVIEEKKTTGLSGAPRKSLRHIMGAGLGLAIVLLLAWWSIPPINNLLSPSPPGPPPEMNPYTNSIGMTFVLIPAGAFQMGSPVGEADRIDDERRHRVTISQAFYLQTTEVTQGQWQKVMGDNPSSFYACGKDCPVENVSWSDAQAFIKTLNKLEQTDKYRLPTEAEWEYACRAGNPGRFCFGDDEAELAAYAWFLDNSGKKTHPVGRKKPNAWWLHDMHGNVWEWCQDWYGLPYAMGSGTDPQGPPTGEKGRVLRGGSWGDHPWALRSAFRYRLSLPIGKSNFIGFRVARTF